MKKNPKKIKSEKKKLVNFLVQKFLEADHSALEDLIADENKMEIYWETLVEALIGREFWMDEIDPEDRKNIDKPKSIFEYHDLLKPLWEQLKLALTDYENRIVPMKINIKELERNIAKDRSSEYSQYKELIKTSDVVSNEKYYDISLHFKVSFDLDNINFYKRKINIISNFLDLFNDLPLSLFSQCNHCGKIIVMTRSDKQYCPGCAAKRYQKEIWEKDPEGMKQKERLRYRTKRKRID
jgi:rubrerythrin